MSGIVVREEKPADKDHIHRVTELAFRGRPYADGDEQEVVNRLRQVGALALSLVAVEDDALIAQITFSPAEIDDGSGPWFALGPVSVLPGRQGEGIGSLLINEGLARVEAMGALGCILTGNPDYYQRFGFGFSPANVPARESAAHFMLKRFRGGPPEGAFSFHRAFYEDV